VFRIRYRFTITWNYKVHFLNTGKPQKSNIININQEGHIFNVSRIISKESFICLGGVANKRLALAQALRTDGRTIPKLGYNKNSGSKKLRQRSWNCTTCVKMYRTDRSVDIILLLHFFVQLILLVINRTSNKFLYQ
jgi:hypothetical protein